MENVETYNMEIIIGALMAEFPLIDDIYIFGSRRYNTGSTRSDVDLLLITSGHIKPSDLRTFSQNWCRALDLFIVSNGRAISCINESYIEAADTPSLLAKVDALKLWDRIAGKSAEIIKRRSEKLDRNANLAPTVLPNSSADYYTVKALRNYFKSANEHGLPTKPYLGESTEEASDFIIEVLRSLIRSNESVGNTGAGRANKGWNNNISDEYDFQNLFWITVKPWLPGLSREDIILNYDGQNKKSDFNLFNNQLIIELKHIKDSGDARAVVKTLEGLASFYSQHPNVRVLLFAILVDKGVNIDGKKWETDYTYVAHKPIVKTIVIRNK